MRADILVGGKYRLVRPIGAGGMGVVWLARNEMTEREFAIKFLHAHAAQSPKMLQRFFQEARVSGKLRHPSLLEIFDVGTAKELDDAPYLVMELLDGAPLDGVIRRLGRLPIGMALEIAAAVARAMALAHDKGIVHRDLKPANVFLHKPGSGALVAKVLDFGISKVMSQPEMGPSLGLTQTGAVLGSPLYMSPEQVEGTTTLDGRSDLYSLGVVLWECLVGKAPYRATSYNLLIVEKLAPGRPRLRDVLPDVPPVLDALGAKLLARDRDERFASAREVADALDAARASLGLATILDRATAAQWLFAQMSVPSPAPPPMAETSTTGAVSVPRPQMQSSPAAYTVGGASPGDRPASPFARTTPAPETPARAVTSGSPDARTRPEPPAREASGGLGPRIALAAGAAFVCVGAGFAAWRAASPSPLPAASVSAIAPAASPPASALVATATAIASAPAPASPSAAPASPSAELAAPAASAPLVPAATAKLPRPSRAAPAPRAHAARDGGAAPANRGIVDDGL